VNVIQNKVEDQKLEHRIISCNGVPEKANAAILNAPMGFECILNVVNILRAQGQTGTVALPRALQSRHYQVTDGALTRARGEAVTNKSHVLDTDTKHKRNDVEYRLLGAGSYLVNVMDAGVCAN
jgi:hypothetical protein